MSKSCQKSEQDVLVRFWSIDQPTRATVKWPISAWAKLIFAADGTLVVRAGDHLSVLPPNRALWVPPGWRHEMSCRSAVRVRTLYFHPTFALSAPTRPIQVRGLFKELIVETCRIGPLLSRDAHHACLAQLLCNEITAATVSPVDLAIPQSDLTHQASRLVVENPAAYGNVPSILAAVRCSRRTLERRFQVETGMSLGKWIQQARLVLSVQDLSVGESLLDVALRAGYASASAYSYAFRLHFGLAPREWIGLG